jgi:hypothetical protein
MLVGETDIKGHGKKAFLSHVIPVIFYLVIMAVFYLPVYLTGADQPDFLLVIIGVSTLAVITIGVVIWNVVQGVKVIKNNLKQ